MTTLNLARPEWHQRAACRGAGPDLFHPSKGEVDSALKARTVCSTCPVSADCLLSALATPGSLDYGVWAATSPRERRAIRRRMGGPAARVSDASTSRNLGGEVASPPASDVRRANLADLLAGDDPSSLDAGDVAALADLLDVGTDQVERDLRVLRQDRIRRRSAGGLPSTGGRVTHAHDAHLEAAS